MPQTLNGSCHCRTVKFTVQSHTPVPYQQCACSICRKLGGPAGTINLGGIASTLQILSGHTSLRKYHALKDHADPNNDERFDSERNFCGLCGTMLWLYDKTFPELIHPFSSAVDTDLTCPPNIVCIMGEHKPKWARWPEGDKTVYSEYLEESLDDWHKKHGLYCK
ncbi:DUF636 domain protein [Melanomma pulvis-pyrius CBS 109.77]|uniref:DUF636 domain protein n=1 Tax=Melanomma pulvis-pyrius CBS 109.77 TaxID=1314802 RepID=A0A6A6X3N8_9PLEO|nr:DUF636 domain protein [Melanomma pulvis-pyrius CBS 109.77]